ncbi:sensor histidine kinase [Aquiflexum lacus]|uniref:sensor histidine kinase n=1 Tax=Aquiflexum lacus TaxID=2483805 RepID=UPI001893C02F|nr:7TM diverse intracellular signaling domain-containing protein [Aquiflexum lacus]
MKPCNRYLWFVVVWGAIFWVGEVFAESFQIQPFPVVYPNEELLGSHMFYWEEVGENSPDQVLKKFLNGEFTSFGEARLFNRGYTESIWWFAFVLENSLDENNKVIFSPVGAAIKEGILYTFDENGELLLEQYSGFLYAGSERDMNSRINSYQVILPPLTQRFFLLKVDSRGLNTYIPFYLDGVNEYWEYEVKRTSIYGTVTGILLMATGLGLFFWFYFKESMYLAFAGYLISSLILILEEDGFLFLWVYGEYLGELSAIIIPLFSVLMSVFLLQFIHYFFRITPYGFFIKGKSVPLFYAIYLYALLVFLTFFLTESYSFNRYVNGFALLLSFINMMLVLYLTFSQFKKKGKITYFIFAALAVLIFGFSNYVLNLQGITDWHPLKPNGLIFGSIVNVIVLTIGLSHRYYQIRRDKDRLTVQMLEQERKTAQSIIQAQEKERQRIAKDLHDDLGGLLAMIKLKIDSILLNQKENGDNKTSLEETQKLMQMACHDLRFIAHELMPLEAAEKRLKTMVSEVLDLVKVQNKIKISYDIGDIPYLNIDTKINLFRIIKELLNNIIKHSEASEADIQVFFDNYDDSITLMVSDNGKGIPDEFIKNPNGGMGLSNLQKRVNYLKGQLHFDVNKNGTTVIVTVPFEKVDI